MEFGNRVCVCLGGGLLVKHIWDNFDLAMFNVTLVAFGGLAIFDFKNAASSK